MSSIPSLFRSWTAATTCLTATSGLPSESWRRWASHISSGLRLGNAAAPARRKLHLLPLPLQSMAPPPTRLLLPRQSPRSLLLRSRTSPTPQHPPRKQLRSPRGVPAHGTAPPSRTSTRKSASAATNASSEDMPEAVWPINGSEEECLRIGKQAFSFTPDATKYGSMRIPMHLPVLEPGPNQRSQEQQWRNPRQTMPPMCSKV